MGAAKNHLKDVTHLKSVDYDQIEDEFMHQSHGENHDMHGAKKVEEGEGPWLVSYADLMTLLMGFFALIASMSKPDVKAFEQAKKTVSERFGGEYKEPYKELESKINKSLEGMNANGKVQVTRGPDGVILKFSGTSLFDSGSFIVNPEGQTLINTVIDGIKDGVTKYKVDIEGHTDNVPISDAVIASNWELSAIRSARVAQILEERGFKKEQISIQGWGETKPEFPNVDKNGQPIAANQAKNRRVILKISE